MRHAMTGLIIGLGCVVALLVRSYIAKATTTTTA
jgi:hypothetical protein